MPTDNSLEGFDFAAIARAFTSGKWVIAAFVAFFVILGSIYTAVRIPQYKAEVLVFPPSEKDLKGLILALIPLNRADSPEIYDLLDFVEIFKAFKMELASRQSQYGFIKQFGEELNQSTNILPEYDLASSDGFGRRARNGDYAKLTTDWRLGHDHFLHWSQFHIGDPVLSFTIESDRTTSRPYLLVTLTWENPRVAADFANRYVDFVNNITVSKARELLLTGLEIRATNLSDMISYERTLARRALDDSVQKLTEAIETARELDIEEPTNAFGDYNIINIVPPSQYFINPNDNPPLKYNHRHRGGQSSLPLYHPGNISKSAKISEQMLTVPPLYTRGWKALEQERNILQKRASLDISIPNIHDLTGELEWIQSIKPEKIIFSAAHVPERALPPTKSSGYSATAIILFSVFLGLVTGLFSVLSAHVLRSFRMRSPEQI